ncbi:MAG TPA: metalloregulator ArsR/SmtB family transcription factor [Candidatus Limnocylindria bacterium]|nr:metalloregulator ArsR/SmtB family transcription factor [Candidatus Limnocylindria bacterium]
MTGGTPQRGHAAGVAGGWSSGTLGRSSLARTGARGGRVRGGEAEDNAPLRTNAPRTRGRNDLRVCASDEIIAPMEAVHTTDAERQRAAAIARALADPKRLCVVERLSAGEQSVSDLSREVGCQVPNMSQHLAVLRSAGLVRSRRAGSTVFYRLADDRVLDAYRLLHEVAG